MNDTKHPQPRAHITIRGSKIDKMPASEFIGLCECALIFFREGIVSIDEDYKRRGGIEHRLPETTRLDALF